MAKHDHRDEGGKFAQDDSALYGAQRYRDDFPTAGSEPAGWAEIEKLNGAPFSDHEIGPGTKDFDGD